MANFSLNIDNVLSDEETLKLIVSGREELESCDIFGDKEPWAIFEKDVDMVRYAFVDLKKKNEEINDGRIDKRSAGCGTWSVQGCKPVYNSERQIIGHKKLRIFLAPPGDGDGDGDNGRWVMDEYLTNEYKDDYVMCAIRNIASVERPRHQYKYGERGFLPFLPRYGME